MALPWPLDCSQPNLGAQSPSASPSLHAAPRVCHSALRHHFQKEPAQNSGRSSRALSGVLPVVYQISMHFWGPGNGTGDRNRVKKEDKGGGAGPRPPTGARLWEGLRLQPPQWPPSLPPGSTLIQLPSTQQLEPPSFKLHLLVPPCCSSHCPLGRRQVFF